MHVRFQPGPSAGLVQDWSILVSGAVQVWFGFGSRCVLGFRSGLARVWLKTGSRFVPDLLCFGSSSCYLWFWFAPGSGVVPVWVRLGAGLVRV